MPANLNPADDGFLRASEIATLHMDNAEWVLLTACNTASADGVSNAEPLSGLARAFFIAGARSLLVSHWSADATATAALTTALFTQRQAGETKAQALSRAMRTIRNDTTHPQFAHPALWAPFTVVGEGR
jgi:CHAT domain-containing protein